MTRLHLKTALFLSFALTLSPRFSGAQADRGPEPLALIHANVLDVRAGRVVADPTVVLRGGKIESVSAGPVAEGLRTLDLSGRTLRKGVLIVTGGDTSYGPNSITRVSHEIQNLVKLGLTPIDALRAATVNAAVLLRMGKSVGAVEPGFEADLVAVAENPLEDVGTLQDPLLVVSNGRTVIDRLHFGKK